MAGPSSPINIATQPRQNPNSPRNTQTSNLTSALQGASGEISRPAVRRVPSGTNGANGFATGSGRHDSMSGGLSGMGFQWSSEARPIAMNNSNRERPRRESLAGSLVGGMSWGGVSVGSWIRDDIIMAGTSPFTFQSPSYHSSSYLPKLEANFMKDFSCCGITLPSLHDLLQHYEECHAQQAPPTLHRTSQSNQSSQQPNSKAAIAAGAAAAVQQQAQEQQQRRPLPDQSRTANVQSGQNFGVSSTQTLSQPPMQTPQPQSGGYVKTPLPTVQDMDAVEDMEMDDDIGDSTKTSLATTHQSSQFQQHPQMQFGQPGSARVPPLNLNTLNMANALQSHQGLRTSQPTTPVSGRPGHPYQNNPTVSSVNTPTLSTHPLQHHFRHTPDSSAPGTPAELDEDFGGTLPGDLLLPGHSHFLQGQNPNFAGFGGFGIGNGNDMLDLCIDEPAKRLFSPNGGFNTPHQYAQFRLGGGQYGPNSELAKRIREQQMMVGIGEGTAGMMPGEEIKPFRCPVIGCEKAYKNQNGLKYHKTHGHTNQQLHENADGTFSIVNPETSVPYPGTVGMEKEKPFRCEVCGKRYKNLNGLKYHKSHSPPCNPELKLAGAMNAPINMQGLNVNIAGAGLTGIGEEMVQ